MKLVERNFDDTSKYLWTDLISASSEVARKPLKSPSPMVSKFITDGYTTAKTAAHDHAIDKFMAELNKKIDNPESGLFMTYWDTDGKHHEPVNRANLEKLEAKVLDVHQHVESAADLIFSPQIIDFLRDVFGEDPVAFQTLYFEYGSSQGAHNDTAFVFVDPPSKFVASWIAIEDISPSSGELFYYPSSHNIGDQIFDNGGKAYDPSDEHAAVYTPELERILAERQIHRQHFLPNRGDVLFWAANLVHGGETILNRRTRRSLVTHYCPLSAAVPYARHLDRQAKQTSSGGWIVSET